MDDAAIHERSVRRSALSGAEQQDHTAWAICLSKGVRLSFCPPPVTDDALVITPPGPGGCVVEDE
jgi:hypothetical protein